MSISTGQSPNNKFLVLPQKDQKMNLLTKIVTLVVGIVASWFILFHLQYIRFVPATMFFSEKLMKISLLDYAILCLGVRYSFVAMMPTSPQTEKSK